jgi:hypothetical protein
LPFFGIAIANFGDMPVSSVDRSSRSIARSAQPPFLKFWLDQTCVCVALIRESVAKFWREIWLSFTDQVGLALFWLGEAWLCIIFTAF